MIERNCSEYGTEDKLTMHHDGFGGIVYLCRPCHNAVHGTVEKDKLRNAKRRIQRAKR